MDFRFAASRFAIIVIIQMVLVNCIDIKYSLKAELERFKPYAEELQKGLKSKFISEYAEGKNNFATDAINKYQSKLEKFKSSFYNDSLEQASKLDLLENVSPCISMSISPYPALNLSMIGHMCNNSYTYECKDCPQLFLHMFGRSGLNFSHLTVYDVEECIFSEEEECAEKYLLELKKLAELGLYSNLEFGEYFLDALEVLIDLKDECVEGLFKFKNLLIDEIATEGKLIDACIRLKIKEKHQFKN